MLRRSLVLMLLIGPALSAAQRSEVAGVAFIDANGNGVRDGGERGLANVVVSNQDAVVATDASGAYRLPREANGVLFVSVPDGYRTVGSFWRRGERQRRRRSISRSRQSPAPLSSRSFTRPTRTSLPRSWRERSGFARLPIRSIQPSSSSPAIS